MKLNKISKALVRESKVQKDHFLAKLKLIFDLTLDFQIENREEILAQEDHNLNFHY